MKYKVNVGSPTLASFCAMSGGLIAATTAMPDPYKGILIGLIFLGIVAFVIKIGLLSRNHRFLFFGENELLFAKHTIRSDDIKYIYTYERNRCFIIYFKGKKRLAISVAFKKTDEEEIRSQLRGWTWRNGVQTKTARSGWRKKSK